MSKFTLDSFGLAAGGKARSGVHRLVSGACVALLGMLMLTPASAALPIQHWTTANGVRVFFVNAPSIPMLDVQVDFDAGTRREAPDKTGLANITAGLLAKGVPGVDEAAIAEGFARIGAIRGASADADRTSITLRTLATRTERDAAVALLAKVIQAPLFPANILAREQERTIQALREAQTKPETIASERFMELLYPAHPYGRSPTPESVAAITRDDLVAFHHDNYVASRAVVAMIGAVTRSEAEAIAESLVGALPAGAPAPALPPVAAPVKGQTELIAHPATQSHILYGMPGIARGDPDYFPLLVGNHVLGGGGFVSRLVDEVREKRGLAYSVYSYFSPEAQPGPFTIGAQTQKERADETIKVIKDTVAQFIKDGPSAAELRAAKDNLVGGFALRIDSNRKILANLAMIGFYGMPLDYLERWPERAEAVTLEQVRAAFARHIDPERMTMVVVGAGGKP